MFSQNSFHLEKSSPEFKNPAQSKKFHQCRKLSYSGHTEINRAKSYLLVGGSEKKKTCS
jgi:hypothetical protein